MQRIIKLMNCNFLALSATVGNAEQLKDWMETVRGQQLKDVAVVNAPMSVPRYLRDDSCAAGDVRPLNMVRHLWTRDTPDAAAAAASTQFNSASSSSSSSSIAEVMTAVAESSSSSFPSSVGGGRVQPLSRDTDIVEVVTGLRDKQLFPALLFDLKQNTLAEMFVRLMTGLDSLDQERYSEMERARTDAICHNELVQSGARQGELVSVPPPVESGSVLTALVPNAPPAKEIDGE